MAKPVCSACEDLRENSPNLAVNGFTDNECKNLTNSKGLSGDGENCADMHDMNDCFIGMMDNEVDAYDSCDWREFMHRFIPNLWATLKGIICWLCGVDCRLNYMMQGAEFRFGEDTTGKESRLVKGKGVDFTLRSSSDVHSSDVTILYVGGAICYLTGSLYTFKSSYVDKNGETHAGNSVWNYNANDYDIPSGGELMYEIRIKKSEYPMLRKLYRGEGWNGGGGQDFFQTAFLWFNEGHYAYGQHGWCDDDGTPSKEGYSSGHLVPEGWMYIQCRMLYVGHIPIQNDIKDGSGHENPASAITPHGYMGVRLNTNKIEC